MYLEFLGPLKRSYKVQHLHLRYLNPLLILAIILQYIFGLFFSGIRSLYCMYYLDPLPHQAFLAYINTRGLSFFFTILLQQDMLHIFRFKIQKYVRTHSFHFIFYQPGIPHAPCDQLEPPKTRCLQAGGIFLCLPASPGC